MDEKDSMISQKNELGSMKKACENLRNLADTVKDLLVFIDIHKCYIAVNEAYAKFHNKTVDEFSGVKVEDVIGIENFTHIGPLIQRSLNGESFKISSTYQLPNKKDINGEVSFKPIKNDNNIIIGCVAIIKNISKQKEEVRKIESTLHEQNELFQMVNDENPDIILMRDYDGKFLFVNDALAKLYATTPKEMIGKTDETFNPNKEQRDFFLENIRTIMDKFETEVIYETSTDVNSGEIRYFKSIKKPLKDKHGNLSILVIAHDITDLRENELQLQQFAAVTKNSREGVVIVDTNKNILAINESFTTITGYSEEDSIGQKVAMLKSKEHGKNFYANMWKSIETTDKWSGEIWNKTKDNTIYPEWLSISTIRNNNGEIMNYVGIFSDLSGEKASEDKINFLALHDTLTGLSNRYQFENRLEHALLGRENHNTTRSLLFLDLDNFKDINDRYGHDTGDKVLKYVAKVLKQLVRQEDTLARFGGDEFVILSEHLHSDIDSSTIAQKIIDKFKYPITIDNQLFHLSFSIGIALYPHDGRDKSTLLKAADVAMYKAKDSGKNCFSFYDTSLTDTLKSRLEIEYDLRTALEEKQFELYYQPQVSLKDGSIIGLESLIRWNHPKKGLLTPNEFITIAEQAHIIIPLGTWILHTACKQAQSWYKEGIFNGRISVNISAIQLEYSDLPNIIEDALSTSGLDPNHLSIEITESAIMHDPNNIVKLFAGLKTKGVHFSIDDFGTGYSSLSYLRQLPLDVLKIDKSFIDDLPHSLDDAIITETIISLASKLGLKTIAEGVETKEQVRYLIDAGCTSAQGYFYDKPLNAKNTKEALLNKKYNTN